MTIEYLSLGGMFSNKVTSVSIAVNTMANCLS